MKAHKCLRAYGNGIVVDCNQPSSSSTGTKTVHGHTMLYNERVIKHHGPSYNIDLAVHQMESEMSSYVRVAMGSSKIMMMIELKTNVPTAIQSVPLKDILELLVYLLYVMGDNHLTTICGVLSDTKTWHCLRVKLTKDDKLQILRYIQYHSEDEIKHLGFLSSLADTLQLE